MASKMKYTDIRQMIIRLIKLLCFKRLKKNRDNVKFWALSVPVQLLPHADDLNLSFL